MAWLSLTEWKTLQGVTGTENDAQVTALLPLTEQAIEDWIGRKIEAADYVEDYDGYGTTEIVLRNRPVTEFGPVIQSPNRTFGEDPMDTSVLSMDPDSGVLSIDTGGGGYDPFLFGSPADAIFHPGKRTVRVEYTAGYLAANIPGDLKLLLAEVVSARLNSSGSEGIKSETLGSYSYTLGDSLDSLSPTSKATLDAWRDRSNLR